MRHTAKIVQKDFLMGRVMNAKDSDIEAMRKEFVTTQQWLELNWSIHQEVMKVDRELSLQIRVLGISMIFYILTSEIFLR